MNQNTNNTTKKQHLLTLDTILQLSEKNKVVITFTDSLNGATELVDVIFEKLSALQHPNHFFKNLDVKKYPELVRYFQIEESPTVIVLSKGKVRDRFAGIHSKKNILQRLDLY